MGGIVTPAVVSRGPGRNSHCCWAEISPCPTPSPEVRSVATVLACKMHPLESLFTSVAVFGLRSPWSSLIAKTLGIHLHGSYRRGQGLIGVSGLCLGEVECMGWNYPGYNQSINRSRNPENRLDMQCRESWSCGGTKGQADLGSDSGFAVATSCETRGESLKLSKPHDIPCLLGQIRGFT